MSAGSQDSDPLPSASFADLAMACAEGRAMMPYWQRHPAVAEVERLRALVAEAFAHENASRSAAWRARANEALNR